jgi:hypothetical protein
MSDDSIEITKEMIEELMSHLAVATAPVELEFRVYYNDDGSIITYTTEKLDGNYLVITREDYQQARHDAKVLNGKLIYTHMNNNVTKLQRNKSQGIRTSKYDVSILASPEDPEYSYFTPYVYEIK